MKKKIRVGIIGCGLMGGIHAACYAREPNCEIVGYWNRTRDKAERLATQFGGKIFGSVAALLAAPEIDAVCISTVQQFHAEQVLAACKADKHIFCEKPVGLTVTEFDAMQLALETSGVTFMIGHQLRFHPVVQWLQQHKPRLGRVFHSHMEMNFLIRGHEGRCFEDYRSGGFFMELGCHLADLSRFLMGEVHHVSGHTLRLDDKRVTEDCTHALLQFQSGAIGSILVSANMRSKRQGLLIGKLAGENGHLEFSIYPYSRAFNTASLVLDGMQSTFVPDTKIVKFPIQSLSPSLTPKTYAGFFDIYQQEARAFLHSIRTSTLAPITFEDGRRAVEIVLAAYSGQGDISDSPNFQNGLRRYRADQECHPALKC